MSKYKNTKSWNRGQKVEADFFKLLKKFDPKARKANREDQYRHIDFHSAFGKIDVKARKKINRRDSEEQEELIWVEFKNVGGREGWLFGSADLIAFEREKDFLVVKRILLMGLCQSLCNTLKRVEKSGEALYKGYQRAGRKDLISMIKMSDLLALPHDIWRKEQ
jgi:hypothetical protein